MTDGRGRGARRIFTGALLLAGALILLATFAAAQDWPCQAGFCAQAAAPVAQGATETPSPTPTATRTPAGLLFYDINYADCQDMLAENRAVVTPSFSASHTGFNNDGYNVYLSICNLLNSAVRCSVDAESVGRGLSPAVNDDYNSGARIQNGGAFDPPAHFSYFVATPAIDENIGACDVSPGVGGGNLGESRSAIALSADEVCINPVYWQDGTEYNRVWLYLKAYGTGCNNALASVSYDVSCAPLPTGALCPTATAMETETVTPTPSRTPSPTFTPLPSATPVRNSDDPPPIIDYFPCNTCAPCCDYNLRSNCGANDLWVGLGATGGNAGGTTLEVRDAGDNLICARTLAADNLMLIGKRIFLDEMTRPDGSACQGWPTTGYFVTRRADGTEAQRVAYAVGDNCGKVFDAAGTPAASTATRTPGPGGTPTPSRTPPPWTPYPAGAGGLVLVRDFNPTVTPQPGQSYSHYDMYWDTAQPSLAQPPNWGPAATRVAYMAAQGLDTWLSLQFFQCAWGATPDSPEVPAGVPTVTYTAGACGTEYAPNYGAAGFRQPYATAVASFGAAFNSNAHVAGAALQLGCSGEAVNVYNQTADGFLCPNQVELEKQVSCAEYLAFVYDAIDWWRAAFPGKPLTLATGIGACAGRSDWSSIRDLMNYAAARGVMFRYNGLAPGSSDFYRLPGSTPYPYGRVQYGAQAVNGAAFEPGSPYGFATQVPAGLRPGYADDMLYAAAANGARYVFLQKDWFGDLDATARDLVTATLGQTADDSAVAWVRFRGPEFGVVNPGAPDFRKSDLPGPHTFLAQVVGAATPEQYCSPSVRATAQAFPATPPKPCPQTLATPFAPESRNVLRYAANQSVGVDVADDWQYAGAAQDFDLALVYLDSGADNFTVAWRTAGGEQTQTLTKTNTNTWQRAAVTLTGAVLNNGLPTGGDVELRTGSGAETLYLLILTAAGGLEAAPSRGTTASPRETGNLDPALIGAGLLLLAAAGAAAVRRGRRR